MTRAAVVALALGFVMPTFSVLKRLANGRDDLTVTSLKMEGLASVAPALARDVAQDLGTSWVSGELQLNAVLSMRFPGRCRLELGSPDTTKTVVVTWSNGKRRAEGGALPAAQAAVDQACALLSLRSGTEGESRASVERHLTALKVNLKQTSLARWAGTLAIVIGDRAEASPQLWVYKDRFQPARVRYTDEKGQAWDVRFVDYSAQATGDWFPRLVEVYKGPELQLRLSVLQADGKANLDAVKF